jgi:hypothetical protein
MEIKRMIQDQFWSLNDSRREASLFKDSQDDCLDREGYTDHPSSAVEGDVIQLSQYNDWCILPILIAPELT